MSSNNLSLINSPGGERLSHSVLTTILVNISQFEPVASAWYQQSLAKQRGEPVQSFSFKQWVKQDAVTILGRDVENNTAISALNNFFITKAARALLNQPGDDLNRQPHTFLVLDEAHTVGRLPELEELATNGSGRGVSIALAFQSLASLQRIYGYDATAAILGQMYHKGFLRLNDTATAQFASNLIGRAEQFYRKFDGSKWRQTNQQQWVTVVPAESLRRIPPPDKGQPGLFNWVMGKGGTPLKGYYLGNFGFWRRLTPRYISKQLMAKAPVPDTLAWEIPPLPTWDAEDIKRLKLEHVINPADFMQQLAEEKTLTTAATEQLDDILNRLKTQADDVTT